MGVIGSVCSNAAIAPLMGSSHDALLAAVQALSFARTLDDLTYVIRTHARAIIGAEGISFVLRDAGECFYVAEDAVAPLWKGKRVPMESCIAGWVMLYGQPAIVPDISVDGRIPHDAYRRTFVKSLAIVPVRTEAPIAAIGAYWATPHEASPDELHALQTLANGASLALANVQLYGDLQAAVESERNARELAERANRSKDEFLATLSHELRTPLNIIQGWLWALDEKMQPPTDVKNRALHAIERNVELQVRLIEDLLDTSRAIQGRLSIQRRLVDIVRIARSVIDLLAPVAAAKVVSMSLEPASTTPLMLHGDADRLQQVLWNIVSNAIKFTPAGGSVIVSVGRKANRAEIKVRDTGVGISSDFLPHVFDRFRQADGGPTRRFGGLGLGLAIAKQLIELHDGSISAHSEGPGTGTTIAIELPVAPLLDESLARPDQQSEPVPAPSLSGIKVLVVDDESEAGEAVRYMLEQQGAVVWAVTSGEEAIAAVRAHEPDVLLADLAMPGLDGFALIRCIRTLGGPSARVPAAAFSAFTAADYRQQAQQAGFQGYLEKPVAPHELAAEVARLAALSDARGPMRADAGSGPAV